jgi:hypothetical protein
MLDIRLAPGIAEFLEDLLWRVFYEAAQVFGKHDLSGMVGVFDRQHFVRVDVDRIIGVELRKRQELHELQIAYAGPEQIAAVLKAHGHAPRECVVFIDAFPLGHVARRNAWAFGVATIS